jgi:nitroimidazol reductase NimA-like FMN-containing flavoprotein (pyridoxamine 5'-phosphate oxidase superfamily)
MRRQELEITERAEIESIIAEAQVCRLAMCDGDRPYMVPLSFGYSGNTLYFHCATEGRKLDVLGKNSNVCFEMDVEVDVKRGDTACEFGMNYRSVIGFGTASILDDTDQKIEALDVIMKHYKGAPEEYPEALLNIMKVIKIEIESMTAKASQ